MPKPNETAVQEALNDIRLQLQAGGGDIELIEITEDGVVKVKLTGACSGCPGAQMTLQMGVTNAIKKRLGNNDFTVESMN